MTCSRSFALILLTLTGALLLGAAAAAPPDAPPAAAPDAPPSIKAIAMARHDLPLGFTVAGKVAAVKVKPGDRVAPGQVLVELEDIEGQTLVAIYKLRAESDLAIQAAHLKVVIARLEEDRLKGLLAQNAAAPFEYDKAVATRKVAEIEEQQTRQDQEQAKLQYEQSRARHDQYLLKAPPGVAGVVEAVAVEEGQTVEQLKPVLRLVATDPLWIDVPVATADTLGLIVGDSVTVHSALPGHDQPMTARIIHLAAVADPASDTRNVRLELANPAALPAGTQVVVTLRKPAVADGR
ncbi:MAG: HlyD family efflux transporter periplasmic adaptor subunit [Phycisphaeraceae bacterium]